jgi:hypothetical protein
MFPTVISSIWFSTFPSFHYYHKFSSFSPIWESFISFCLYLRENSSKIHNDGITFTPCIRLCYTFVTSVDPDQLAQMCRLIRICTVHIQVKNNLTNQNLANSADPDQTAHMCRLIRIGTVRPCHKGEKG